MKMWEVQTMGYMKGSVLEPGLVSRGSGFTDAPDAEFISEGNHTKRPGQVALGRHGNFFHWGYAGAPEHIPRTADHHDLGHGNGCHDDHRLEIEGPL